VGREAERAQIERLLGDAAAGDGGALVLRGEAGVGKTALLKQAMEAAAGFRILAPSASSLRPSFRSRRCTSSASMWAEDAVFLTPRFLPGLAQPSRSRVTYRCGMRNVWAALVTHDCLHRGRPVPLRPCRRFDVRSPAAQSASARSATVPSVRHSTQQEQQASSGRCGGLSVAGTDPSQQSTRSQSGALSQELALLGQRRGQRSALRYLRIPERSASLSSAALPGRR